MAGRDLQLWCWLVYLLGVVSLVINLSPKNHASDSIPSGPRAMEEAMSRFTVDGVLVCRDVPPSQGKEGDEGEGEVKIRGGRGRTSIRRLKGGGWHGGKRREQVDSQDDNDGAAVTARHIPTLALPNKVK